MPSAEYTLASSVGAGGEEHSTLFAEGRHGKTCQRRGGPRVSLHESGLVRVTLTKQREVVKRKTFQALA